TGTAGGEVEYRHYPSLAECQTDTEAFPATPTGGTSAGTVPVTDGTVPDSDTVTFPDAGTFYWAVFYSGDANNSPVASDCRTEALVVQATPTITTNLSATTIDIGAFSFDSATLRDATATAGGQVQFRFYPTLAACETDTTAWPTRAPTWPTGGMFAGLATVNDGQILVSDVTVTFPRPGTFFWAAFYTGDPNNAPAASACDSERLDVIGVPQLTQDKTVDRQVASVSDTLRYTITIANHGTGDAINVTAHDVLPSQVRLVSANTHGFG